MSTERNRKIEDILNSLDRVEKASAPGFFYTRLKARMEREMVTEAHRSWKLRPVFAFAALLLVILINTAVFLKGNQPENNTASETEIFQSIASEYSLNSNLTYEINQ